MTQAEAVQLVVPGGRLTQGYGWTAYAQSGAYGGRIHDGWDIGAGYGARINWPTSVSSYRWGFEAGGYGNYTQGFVGPWEFLFGHEAQVGNQSYAGLVDSTGFSSGNHTHLRVKLNGVTVDPQLFFNSIGGNMVPQERLDREIAASRKARRNLVGYVYLQELGRPPTSQEVDARQDQDPDFIVSDVKNSAEAKAYRQSNKLAQAKEKAQEIVNL